MTNSKTNDPKASPMIYVVDDEVALLDLAEIILLPLGFQVRTFTDPNVALAEFKKADPRPVLLMTDYAMNVEPMTGMNLIRECRKVNPSQKIILVSGTVGEEIYLDSLEKPDIFLAKPYQAKELIAAVESLVEGKR